MRCGGDEEAINRCIASISKQRLPHCEILVCGNRCSDDRCKSFENGEWVKSGELNRMRNLLCSNATTDFIVLMAENIELSDGWYEAVKDADCLDIVGSRIVTDDGTRAVDWAYQVKLGSMSFPYPLAYDEWTTKAYVSGNFMLLRKRVWERIKFDETLLRGDCDDVDFCLRATSTGFRIGVFPQAEAKYIGGICEPKTDVTFERSRNTVLAFKKAFTTGKEAFQSGDYGHVLAHLTKAAEVVPDDAETLSLIGWTYYFTGRYDQALIVLDEAVALDPASHYAFRGRGWAFLQSRAYEKAVNDLTRALDLVNPHHRDDWLETVRGLSWSNYHVGRFDEAIKYFEALLEKSHSNEAGLLQDIYRGLGWCCYRKEMFSEAAAHFDKAISNIDPRNHELIQDAKRGLELVTLGASRQPPVRDGDVHPIIDLSVTRQQDPPFSSAITSRRSYASVLKGAVRKMLKMVTAKGL